MIEFEHSTQSLPAPYSTDLAAHAFKFCERGGSRIGSIRSRIRAARMLAEPLVSRSMIRNRGARRNSSSASKRLRAICTIHAMTCSQMAFALGMRGGLSEERSTEYTASLPAVLDHQQVARAPEDAKEGLVPLMLAAFPTLDTQQLLQNCYPRIP